MRLEWETADAAECVHGCCRYAAGDKVESWLLELLCLNAAEHVPKLPARLPHPTECDLYYINRDTLFSYHKVPAPTEQQICTAFAWHLCLCSHLVQCHAAFAGTGNGIFGSAPANASCLRSSQGAISSALLSASCWSAHVGQTLRHVFVHVTRPLASSVVVHYMQPTAVHVVCTCLI